MVPTKRVNTPELDAEAGGPRLDMSTLELSSRDDAVLPRPLEGIMRRGRVHPPWLCQIGTACRGLRLRQRPVLGCRR